MMQESGFLKACDDFEKFLIESKPLFGSFHPHYDDALWQMMLSGGKRFRPKLLLAVVEAYVPLLVPSALQVGLAIESLHTYSLIHDDLPAMDDSDTRRGNPTLHKSYDEVTAILAGDALNTYAFYLLSTVALSDTTKVALIKELALSGGAGGMVLGQAIDCFFEGEELKLDQLELLHINKTAKLIAASLKMGGIVVDLKKRELDALETLGIKLGLMFQVNDDIIDATQTSEEAGKDTGNDGEKNSYVNLLGLEKAIEEKERLKNESLDIIEQFDMKLKTNLTILLQKYF